VAAPISGGAFNPAVGVSIGVVDGGSIERIWWYIVGPFMGAALGAIAFRLTHPDEI
jgi:aquaporin Z